MSTYERISSYFFTERSKALKDYRNFMYENDKGLLEASLDYYALVIEEALDIKEKAIKQGRYNANI